MSDTAIRVMGVALMLLVVAAVAAGKLACASLCEERGGRVLWTDRGDVACIEGP